MSNKADKLFKSKLGEHSIAPSPRAWSQVEANLAKKNKGIIWFRVAAALALIGFFTYLLLPHGQQEAAPMADKRPVRTTPQQTTPAVHTDEKPALAQQTQATEEKTKSNSGNKKKNNANNAVVVKQDQSITTPNVVAQNKEVIQEQRGQTQPEAIITSTAEIAVAQAKPQQQKSMKLTFSLPSVKTEADQTQQVAAAEEADDKKSPLQKAMNDIRTGDVLGSLRDAKNDLFAWEFRKDKTVKQH